MKKNLLLWILWLCSTASTLQVYAQDKEFWFAGPIMLGGNDYRNHGGFVFTNPTNRQARVKIKYYRDGSDTTITVPAYSYNHTYYPLVTDIQSKIDVANSGAHLGNPNFNGAIHITSENAPITAYYIFDYEAQQETFMLKGAASLGTKFSITGARRGPITSHSGLVYSTVIGYAYAAIVGTEDGTNVNFTLPVACKNYAAGAHSVTLNKGKTLYLYANGGGDLAGMVINSDKPITITAGETCRNSMGNAGSGGACDQNADQLVTDSYAGNVYVMPLSGGFNNGSYPGGASHNWYRMNNYFELISIEPNTNVQIDWGNGLTPLTTLANAGDTYISDSFKVFREQGCATIVADKPIHIMQNTGHEATTCHIPNFFATNTHMTSFYSYMETAFNIYPSVSLVYKESAREDFTITYPGQEETPLFDWITANARWIDGKGDVPQFAGWKYIRFTLPDAAINKIISVKSLSSVFQLGITSSFYYGTYLNYLTAFNSSFSFDPDSVYTCPGIYTTLVGGIASWYKWTLPDGTIKEGANLNSLKAVDMGMYILEMTQGIGNTNHIIDTCWVFGTNFSDGSSGGIAQSLSKPFKINRPQTFHPTISKGALDRMTEIKWIFEGGTPSESNDQNPTVVFHSTGVKKGMLYMKYETIYPDSTRAVCDSLMEFRIPVLPPSVSWFVGGPSTPDKVGVDDHEKTDDELLEEGQSWENPFNLQDALRRASWGDMVIVPVGTYIPKKDSAFVIDCDSITIIGGFRGWETNVDELIPDPSKTIIQGNGTSAVIFDNNAALKHSGACLSSSTTMKGFTIQGGKAVNGAGILFKDGASGTVAQCIVKNNTAQEDGGGIYIEPHTCGTSDPILYNVEISGNRAKRGGGLYNAGSSPTLTNVTIGGNSASISGGGVYNAFSDSAKYRNTIVYGNLTNGQSLNEEFVNAGGMPRISHSLISGCKGSGTSWNTALGRDDGKNRDGNPIYRRKGYTEDGVMHEGNYRIVPQSPAYNAGYNGYAYNIKIDLDKNIRIYDNVIDMGAYEYHPESSLVLERPIIIGTYPNVTTIPGAGTHYIISQKDFTMTLIPANGHSLKYIRIKTGAKIRDEIQGGIRITHNEDRTVTVLFPKVTEPLNIQLTGVSPVSNTSIEQGYIIRTEEGVLHIRTTKATDIQIYSLAGQRVRQVQQLNGESSFPLPQGVYIVTLNGNTRQKVVIR